MPIRFVSLVIVMFVCTFVIGIFVLYLTKKYEAKAMKAKNIRDAYAAKLMAEVEAKKAAEALAAEGTEDSPGRANDADDSAPVADG